MRIVLEQQKKMMLPDVVQAVRPEQYVLVRMKETADLSQESRMPRGADRRAAVWSDLVDTAKRTQVPAFEAIKELQDKGLVLAARSVPIANAIVVTAAAGSQARSAVVDALKGVAQIGSVLTHGGGYSLPNPIADKPAASQGKSSDSTPNADGIEWGVERIGAPKVWKRGIDGKGVTIGIVDSGIDVNHPSIKQHYRGTNADGSFSNDYNWIDTAGYTVGKLTPNPYDDNGHGTHVSGTSAGGVQGDAIGVAPGAKLIGAKVVFGEEMTSPISTLDALQFMLAPTKTDGSAPDPRKGADVINNSWGASPWEEKESIAAFDALKAAGILVVNAAGNDGPRASTLGVPGALPGHISVAASNSQDEITRFSSRGPSPYAPNDALPMVAAPGASVRSSIPGGRFARFDGTSMASPHVTGAVALMLQAKPNATYSEIAKALTSTALDIDRPGVDQAAGYGRIDVDAAISALLGKDAASAAKDGAAQLIAA